MINRFWFRKENSGCRVRSARRTRRFRPVIELLEDRALPSTFTVTNTGDNGGVNPAPFAGTGTLRQAIIDADADGSLGTDSIRFNIPTTDQNYNGTTWTIAPLAPLPLILRPTELDATSQPGLSFLGPLIELSGANTFGDGLDIRNTSGCTVKGFLIDHFSEYGVDLTAANNNVIDSNTIVANGVYGVYVFASNDNIVQDNFIGTDSQGSPGLGNGRSGVTINAGSTGNHIGEPRGLFSVFSNIISGNGDNGVLITDAGTTGNFVQGNRIGTDPTGSTALPNRANGVLIQYGAAGNTIGGSSYVSNFFGFGSLLAGAGNLISGNTGAGVQIFEANANSVQGNYIGTDLGGTIPVPNDPDGSTNLDGVDLLKGAADNQIGGPSSIDGTGRLMGLGNLISGNHFDGIFLGEFNGGSTEIHVTRNHIEGNFIGTDVTGTAALANGQNGVHLEGGAVGNFIGGTAPGTRNIISANGDAATQASNAFPADFGAGVNIADLFGIGPDENNLVENNYIGTDVTGLHALANLDEGVMIQAGARNNTIGAAGAGNLISGNPTDVVITGGTTTGNKLLANTVGLAADGQPMPAAGSGNLIMVQQGANHNYLGQAGAGNVISGALNFGIDLTDPGTTANTVQGNYIGTDATGGLAVPNLGAGIVIQNGAANNQIGGAGQGNVISGNGSENEFNSLGFTGGVVVTDQNTSGNILEDNLIGTDAAGTQALGNTYAGVVIRNGASGNVIRRALSGNVISGNLPLTVHIGDFTTTAGFGVLITGNGTGVNFVTGNFIGTDGSGTRSLDNQLDGVQVAAGSNGDEIGAAASPNVISGNLHAGISIFGSFFTRVFGNRIGTDVTGTLALGNGPKLAGFGVFVNESASRVLIGNAIGGGNVISGNSVGVAIEHNDNIVTVGGNFIGLDVTGGKRIGNVAGVEVDHGGAQTTIGDNVISGNATGVVLAAGGGTLLGNLIGTDSTGRLPLSNGFGIRVVNPTEPITLGIPGAGNVIAASLNDGINFQSGTQLTDIQGNFIGTDATGATALPNAGYGIRMGDVSNTMIGGTDPGAGNVIAGNRLDGIHIEGGGSNIIAGNSIGTDLHDMLPLGNGGDGVSILNSSGNTIGGALDNAGNFIEFNHGNGVHLTGATSSGSQIQGDFIGTDVDGTADQGNLLAGVRLDAGATNNGLIDNRISFNGRQGVVLAPDAGTGNEILDNSITGNALGGIDLKDDGPSNNISVSPQPGPNHLQNYPVIISATAVGGTTVLRVTLNSVPSILTPFVVKLSYFNLQFFANDHLDADGNAQGQTPLYPDPQHHSVSVLMTVLGNTQTVTVTLPVNLMGKYITATATGAVFDLNDTSEFSKPVLVVADAPLAPIPVTLTVTGNKNFAGIVGLFTDADPAVTAANYTATITWDDGSTSAGVVSGSGPFVVTAAHRFGYFRGPHTIVVTVTDADGAQATITDAVIDPPARSARRVHPTAILHTTGTPSVTVASVSVFAGVRFSLTVKVEDAYGNIVKNYTGTIHFTSSDDTARLPNDCTFTAARKGVHTFTGLVLRKKGIQTITISDPLNSSLTASVIVDVL
jgi:parallel beta-helix repeat protein